MKKLLIGLTILSGIVLANNKTMEYGNYNEKYIQLLYEAIGIDKYYDKLQEQEKNEDIKYVCPYTQPSEIDDMPFFTLLDINKGMCTTFRLEENSMIPDYTEMKKYIDNYLKNIL